NKLELRPCDFTRSFHFLFYNISHLNPIGATIKLTHSSSSQSVVYSIAVR
ncbi:hypothetical protein KSS87_010970, partial [Heliosperma pusillum]